MDKKTIINGLNSWETNKVYVFDGLKYKEVKMITKGMGKGIILHINIK